MAVDVNARHYVERGVFSAFTEFTNHLIINQVFIMNLFYIKK